MNWIWLIASIMILFSGFVHMILGDRWIFNQLDASTMNTHYSGEITKITLRWFWHVGSFIIFLNAITVFIMAVTDGILPNESFMAQFVAIIYAGFTVVLIVVNGQKLSNLREFPQAILFIVFIILLLWGA